MSEDAGPVLFCYDGSEGARRALTAGARLFPGRRSVVITVWQSPWHSVIAPPLAGMPADAGEQLERAGATRARELSAEAAKLVPGAESRAEQRHGPIWQTILETADSMEAAVIVVGSRGLSGLRSSLLGSVSHALVNRARRPVLVIPPDDPD